MPDSGNSRGRALRRRRDPPCAALPKSSPPVRRDSSVLPLQYSIDYEDIFSATPAGSVANAALFLQRSLPSLWRQAYRSTVSRQTNLVHLRLGSFEYICDVYSDLEAKGEIAYDQTIQDRVVAAFGISRAKEPQNARRSARWLDANEQLAVSERDHGHLIALCLGGSGLGLNVFSQDRGLNRGRSEQGKIYRQMERYCQERPGTFYFSRPIYADGSCVPRWLELGVLKDDRALWVEAFDN